MGKNTKDSFNKNPIKPTGWQVLTWEIAMPKEFLTTRGMLWRKADITCFVGFIIFVFCWIYFQNVEWACEFQIVPK